MENQIISFKQLNTDVADKFLPEGHYTKMINCRVDDLNDKGGGVVKNIRSTLQISSPTFGESVTYIGGCLDSKRYSVIAFYKGVLTLYITSLNTKNNSESIIYKTTKVPFSARINNAFVLNDLLFWIDSLGSIRKLNVQTCSSITADSLTSDQLLIDKLPPLYPPMVESLNDTDYVTNNITNQTFQFAYAFEFKDNEVSSWSPFSKSVLPYTTNDISFPNNAIDVTVNTGDSQVTKIHIGYRSGCSRNWNLAKKIDKDKLSISDNTTYVYRFYNNQFLSALVQTDVLINTFNPFHKFGSIALSKDNFIIGGLVNDGLEKPTNIVLSLDYTIAQSSVRHSSYKFGAIHEFGVIFRDINGRTDGVNAVTQIEIPFMTSSTGGVSTSVGTILSNRLIPYPSISWEVSGTPPSWAKTMSIVYLGNKSLYSFVQYVLKKIEDIGIYTYLNISPLNTLKDTVSVLDPGTPSSILPSYTFTKGDRIRFITDNSGALLSGTFDYEILGYVSETTDSGGNVYFPDTLFVDKISNWASSNIGEKSIFEIYSPKKEFSDNIYYEIAEVFQITDGIIQTTSGTLTDGDSYVFNRSMSLYGIGELVSDKDTLYDYTGSVGFTPVMNVLKLTEGIQASNYTINETSGAFYHNTSGSTQTVVITGDYEFTSESNDGYWFVIRRRTDGATIQDFVIFEEPNHTSANQRVVYHKGTIQNTFTVLNGQYLAFYFDNRDNRSAHLIFRTAPKIQITAKIYKTSTGDSLTHPIESKNYSDYYESDEHSLGRPYVELDEDISTKNNIVYSGKYFSNTQINETNKISSINVRSIPYEHGLITAMTVVGDVLKVLTNNKEISFYLGKEQYADGSGAMNLALSNSEIGSMRVYDADRGTENPESLMSNGSNLYYYDLKNKTIICSSKNGQIDLSDYGLKTKLKELSDQIIQSSTYSVLIGYNKKNKEVMACFIIDGTTETVVFNERDNIWKHSLEYYDSSGNPPIGIINYGEMLIIYMGGSCYINEGGSTYNQFFGHSKTSTIRYVINQNPINTKILRAVSLQSSALWQFIINGNTTNDYPAGTYTKILTSRFIKKEGIQFSDVPMNLKDKNGTISVLGYAKGNPMRGQYFTCEMTNSDTAEVQLDNVSVFYDGSAIQ